MNLLTRTPLHFISISFLIFSLSGCGGGGGGSSGSGGTTTSNSSMAAASSSVPTANPLDSIKASLDSMPPSMTASNEIRTKTIQNLDDILWAVDETKATPPEVVAYYKSRIAKIAAEMQLPVQSGFRVWNLYNHGFIVKTPTTTFAFDLVEGKNGWDDVELPPSILDQISALFISHEHGDHYDETEKIPAYIKNHGGAVVYPKLAAQKKNVTLLADGYETIQIKDLTVNTYTGEHNVPVLIYEVITADGYKIVHTGDNQDSRYLPELDNIHVLLLNGWVNESGNASAINLDGMKNSLSWMKPDVMIPGHFEELGHHRFDRTGRYRYTEGLTLQNDITQKSKTIVLTWGEKLDYTSPVCASPLVKIYNTCSMPLPKTAVEFKIQFHNEFSAAEGIYPSGIAEDEKSVWVSKSASGSTKGIIYQYDKGNGKLLGSIPVPSGWAHNLTFDGTDLWLTDYTNENKIFKLSRTNGEILSSIPFDKLPLYYSLTGLAVSAEFLYLAVTSHASRPIDDTVSKIYKVDKNTGAILAIVYESTNHKISGENSNGGISGLALANNSLWFTSFYSGLERFTFSWKGHEIVTGQISKLTNISLNGEVLSAKDISPNFVQHLSPGVDYLLYIDNGVDKVRIP
jgi:L-ascorbate metabolism protein UlaG (beta-lactamase superfamily)